MSECATLYERVPPNLPDLPQPPAIRPWGRESTVSESDRVIPVTQAAVGQLFMSPIAMIATTKCSIKVPSCPTLCEKVLPNLPDLLLPIAIRPRPGLWRRQSTVSESDRAIPVTEAAAARGTTFHVSDSHDGNNRGTTWGR